MTSHNVAVAGGELDSDAPEANVYAQAPARAVPPPHHACRMAERYIDLINAGRFGDVADLFEEDAALLEPTTAGVRGRRQIQAFYERTIGSMRPEIIPVAYVGDDKDCMLEIAVKRPVGGEQRYTLISIDHFTVGTSGKFSRMVAFVRPPRPK